MEKITDYKVTDQEIKEKGVQAIQGEVLYGDPSENKKLFDRLVTFLIGKYNSALEWLVDKAHVHKNSELLESVKEENVHSHWNKDVIDGINRNLVTAWNMAAGIEHGTIEALELFMNLLNETSTNLGMLGSGNQYVLPLKGSDATIDMSQFTAFKLKLDGGHMIDFNNVVKTPGKITATCAATDLEITYDSNTATITYKNYDPELLMNVTLYGYAYDILDEETIGMAQSLGFLSGGGSEPT